MAFDFKEQMKVGDVGEKYFLETYREIKPQKSQGRLFDFDSSVGSIELKSDSYEMDKTPNFYFEKFSDQRNFKLGGPWRARQDDVKHFVYLYLRDATFFWFDAKQLSDFLDEYIKGKSYKTVRNKGWTSIGYCVPREEVKSLMTRVDKF